MPDYSLEDLKNFIVKAKSKTYVAGSAPNAAYRPAAHDIEFKEGDFAYLDSYYGGQDFIGEEVVFYKGEAIWAMNYYGYILNPDLITPAHAGHMIQVSLTRMYQEGRFLDGTRHTEGKYTYIDTSSGDVMRFKGEEWIERNATRVYELHYHGGRVL